MVAKKRTAPAEDTHRTNVLLEDIRAQNNAMLEAMSSMRSAFQRTFDERFTPVERRLGLIEDAVRQNSKDIQKNSEDIQRLYEGLAAVRAEVRQLRNDFDQREERARLDTLEKRVEQLEVRLALKA